MFVGSFFAAYQPILGAIARSGQSWRRKSYSPEPHNDDNSKSSRPLSPEEIEFNKKLKELRNKYDIRDVLYNDLVIVKLKGKYECGLVDLNGNEIAPCIYDSLELFYDNFDDYYHDYTEHLYGLIFRVELNGEWKLIDETGCEIVECKYGYIGPLEDPLNLAQAERNGKWGFIDSNGEEVIECKYDCVDHFYNGLARVELNGKWGLIDNEGKEIFKCKYEDIDYFDFSLGVAHVKLNGRWQYIDETGKEIQFDNVAEEVL